MAWLEGREYFWVVLCKNRGFHNKYNFSSGHAIVLAETDEVSSCPQVEDFTVRCDDCGEGHTYTAKDILRAELEPPESLTPHPLFQHSTVNASAHDSVPTPTNVKTAVLERVWTTLTARFRKEPPIPYWRR